MSFDLRRTLRIIRDKNTTPSHIISGNMTAGDFAFQYILNIYIKRKRGKKKKTQYEKKNKTKKQ